MRICFKNDGFDVLPDRAELGGVLQSLRPGHLGHVDQAFDTGLDLNERSVVRQADDFAPNVRALWKAFRHALPRIGQKLLVTEGYPFLVAVEFEHLDLDVVSDLDDVVWRLD